MVVCQVDNILVSGKDDPDHLRKLSEVLCLREAGLRLKREKCKFMQLSDEYLGYKGRHARYTCD